MAVAAPRFCIRSKSASKFFGERQRARFRSDQRPVFIDRYQHGAGLVMLGDGEPALPCDAIEDTSKAILGSARRDLRRIGVEGRAEVSAVRRGHHVPCVRKPDEIG
jgi:hypothetical protein